MNNNGVLSGLAEVNRTNRAPIRCDNANYNHTTGEFIFINNRGEKYSETKLTLSFPLGIKTGSYVIGAIGSPIKSITYSENAVSADIVEIHTYTATDSTASITVGDQDDNTKYYGFFGLNLKMKREGSSEELTLQGTVTLFHATDPSQIPGREFTSAPKY
ncbi:MAG: hypothetical protein NTV76_02015 [Pseudomonas sp.]|nr:hypothetical protein [Pseudomonas sp.]